MATTSEEQGKLLSNAPDDEKGKKKSFGRRLAHNLGSGPFAGSILGSVLKSFKRGGRVHKTGNYRLEKGETVLRRGQRRTSQGHLKNERVVAARSNSRGSRR